MSYDDDDYEYEDKDFDQIITNDEDDYILEEDEYDPFATCQKYRNIEQAKAGLQTAYIPVLDFEQYTTEILRCMEDIAYFAEHYYTILTLGTGEQLIKLYPKQRELLYAIQREDRLMVLASRQTGKTTTYSIFALWYCCFNMNKRVLILAHQLKPVINVIQLIKLSYELLPSWLKPGIIEYNKTKIRFSNGCVIEAAATSGGAGRGLSANCLIIDEMAFIPKNIMDELWAAVYPVISSSLGTKAIGVSTANGIGNLFYELYSEGERNAISPNASAAGWKSIKFLWSDVPGRTEKWKEMQIASLKSMQRWQSEFGCEFLGAAYLLVQGTDLVKMENHINLIDNKSIVVEELNGGQHKQYIRHQYEPGHAYIIGVDVADGIGNDFTVVKVFDITDPLHIIECAYLRENMLSTTDLPYILCKLGLRYGLAPILIESNFSTTVIKLLQEVYEYENIVCSKKGKLGIMATANSKVEACLNFKEIIENPSIVCDFFDMGLCAELKIFEKRTCGNKYGFTYGPKHDNDDTVIASIWAFYIFIEELLQYYFDVDFTYINGKKQPIKCKNFYREDDICNAIKHFNEKIQHTHNVLKSIDTTDSITFESNSFDIYTAGNVHSNAFNTSKLPEW